MVVWFNIESSCPMCGRRLRLRQVGGGFALGQDSDLLVRMEGRHTIQAAIHTCLGCRYSGYADDFGLSPSEAIAKRFRTEITPRLGGAPAGKMTTTPLPDLQYYWAFRCAAFLGRENGELGERLLRAYWCLRLPPSRDLSPDEVANRRRVYLSGAIHHLREDARDGSTGTKLYLLGELNRRHGEFPIAESYFKRFLDTTGGGRGGSPKYLRLAAIKLLRATEHCDSRDRTMEEIVYSESKD